METKAHHALVGFFVVFLVMAGGFFVLWLGQQTFQQDYSYYDVVFDGPVRGLREAGEVRFNGIQVGEVTQISLDPQNPNRVIARIRLQAETPVRVDSSAQLEPQGLTGLSYIQLSGGTAEAQRLLSTSRGDPPRIYAEQAQIESLVAGGEDALEAARLALIQVSTLLNSENLERISDTLDNIEAITERLAGEDALVEDVRSAVQQLELTAVEVGAAARSLEVFGRDATELANNQLAQASIDVSVAAQQIDIAGRQAQELMSTLQPAVERLSEEGTEEITRTMEDLRRLIATLDRIALEIEDNPTGFISGEPRRTVEVPQ
ncbi:MlaD family protein [Hyphobacterium sp. HN65]|uniref:MlaD family protein n=1 Tax=Hyphobacterium lacteum TaxID=3116575 RepID=A0ABU7LRP1_9PROT|nr:MlaD family protein [Hyphobacterium sp. HN65]MEE2526254.1 MlaD family protein [Hyphobacterium sp. HN65]